MSQKFIISEEEKKRIISLHLEATKKQYLNLNEQIGVKPKKATPDEKSFDMSGNFKNLKCVPAILSMRGTTESAGFPFYVYNNQRYAGGSIQDESVGTIYDMTGEKKIGSYTCDSFTKMFWDRYPCVSKNRRAKKEMNDDGTYFYNLGDFAYYLNGRKTDGNTMMPFTCQDDEFKSTPQTPEGLANPKGCPVGTKEQVMAFQDWLDTYKPGWYSRYPDGTQKKVERGYGKCGPNTIKAWNAHNKEYNESTGKKSDETQSTDTTQDTSQIPGALKKGFEQLYQQSELSKPRQPLNLNTTQQKTTKGKLKEI